MGDLGQKNTPGLEHHVRVGSWLWPNSFVKNPLRILNVSLTFLPVEIPFHSFLHREELKQLRSEMFEIEKSLMSQVMYEYIRYEAKGTKDTQDTFKRHAPTLTLGISCRNSFDVFSST